MQRVAAYIAALLLGLGVVVTARAGAPEETVVLTGRNGTHRFKILVSARPFDHRRHTVKRYVAYPATEDSPVQYAYCIDGYRKPLGAFGYLPKKEIFRFEVTVDGRRWAFPEGLWHDCYESRLIFFTALSRDGKRLWIKMQGGDASESYRVIWNLWKDGRCRRTVGYYIELDENGQL
jgi:hypothetical protein